jgi:hypothetical protein
MPIRYGRENKNKYKELVSSIEKWTNLDICLQKRQDVDDFLDQLQQLDVAEADKNAKDDLINLLKNSSVILKDVELKKHFILFVILAAFKTAETIIHRLADNPGRKLNRRFKYAWTQLKHNPDGTVSHNFIHNVGNVPSEYIQTVQQDAKKYMLDKFETGPRFDRPCRNSNLQDSPYFMSNETLEKNALVEDMIISDMQRDDDKLGDIYNPCTPDMSPCGIHDGTKLRSDCVICKEILPEADRPVVISKAFLKKLNVTENLLKFLAIQQDKRARQQATNN